LDLGLGPVITPGGVMRRRAVWLIGVAALGACALWWTRPTARLLFVNGQVLTMDAQRRIADSVLVIDGRIAAVGHGGAPIERSRTVGARRIDLDGATLMPGFVDAHSHFPAVDLGRFGTGLALPPNARIGELATLFERLRLAERALPDERWLLGFDYDESEWIEARHPTRTELDAVSDERPIWLRHRSGHMGVGNSAALAALGIEEGTPLPSGGRAPQDAEGRLSGLLQERAAPSLSRLLQEVPWRVRIGALSHARDVYLNAGVTTVQNGNASPALASLLAVAQRLGLLPQHVVLWRADRDGHPDDDGTGPLGRWLVMLSERWRDEQRVTDAAVKLITDGSPQGMTAWLSEPYPPSSGQAPDYRGVATLSSDVLDARVLAHHAAGRRLAIHANGDAAIDAALSALEAALQAHPRSDHRHLIVHAQTVRTDQLQRMAALGVGASFFPSHVHYWGSWHRRRSLGPARAMRISPLAEADAAGVRYSLHSDAPVTPMRPFDLVAVAAERRMRSGEVLGPTLRISRRRALRALTIDAAWQAGLERDRGSIEPGKRADLIVVDPDPLRADPAARPRVRRLWIDGREHRLP